MSESARVWVEVAFNLSYLVAVWSLVALMIARRERVAAGDRAGASIVRWAFGALALGDTGHVGFRVVAYALGGLEAHPALVGAGALATAVTVTVFYALMVELWRARYGRERNAATWVLLAVAAVRLVFLVLPGNRWGELVAPPVWSLARNTLLTVQGIGVLALILSDAARARDRPFVWIGVMIAVSFAFYAPVILWASAVPLLGMLMIPKTCAYVAIAVVGYRALYTGAKVMDAPGSAA